jgi:hypothetical protein
MADDNRIGMALRRAVPGCGNCAKDGEPISAVATGVGVPVPKRLRELRELRKRLDPQDVRSDPMPVFT